MDVFKNNFTTLGYPFEKISSFILIGNANCLSMKSSWKRPYKWLCSVIWLSLVCLSISCNTKNAGRKFRIGFSQCGDADAWRKSMLAEMNRELAFHPELELVYRQADNNSQLQEKQVKELLDEKIDLLIISPNEAKPLTSIVEEAFNKGIPVVVVDRKIASSLYTNYLGADNYQIGKMAGEYAAALLHGKGNIIEVLGLPTSSPAIERERGFEDGIRSFDGLKIIKKVNGNWVKDQAKSQLEQIGPDLLKTDLIFAHNDVMGLGASEAATAKGNTSVRIIGADALPGAGSGMEFVSDKILTASLLYPTGGAEAIRNALKILHQQPIEKETVLQTLVVDSTNVRMMRMQSDKIIAQQQDIEQQQGMIAEQKRIYNTQRTLLYVLGCTLALAIIFAGLLQYSRQLNKRINRKLAQQNDEISRQSTQLIEMSAQAAAAHETRLNFFTNISHEFRTPLTLIIGPAEEMLKNPRLLPQARQQLELINKNGNRLLRLVNQLIDFRKLEFHKMKIRASKNDLVDFTREIIQAFQEIAEKRNIDCRLITREQYFEAWFDPSLMDQVLFNILSNAFKFTPDNGSILVRLEKNNNSATIEVQDTGIGMTEEEQTHAFEFFFQGDHENHKGSGIGLALSKELVALHQGSIHVTSQKGKGTSFVITIPLDNTHFSEDQLAKEPVSFVSSLSEDRTMVTDLFPERLDINDQPASEFVSEGQTILIIEDNPELRAFLKMKLSPKYNIIEADNGASGLQQVFDLLPDIIICDIMMPGKDGISITTQLKNDLRTAHIPIVILTAKTSVEQQAEGIKSMADAYITKPFNFQLLDHILNNLLVNRHRLKEHYTAQLPTENLSPVQKQSERKFIAEFKSIVENNIGNDSFAIEDISKAMRISKVQLYRKVKTLMNTNINEYILNTRLQKSKYYLQHEDMTIAEVAYKTGFSSPAYFSTVFKSKMGVSPTIFKEKKGSV